LCVDGKESGDALEMVVHVMDGLGGWEQSHSNVGSAVKIELIANGGASFESVQTKATVLHRNLFWDELLRISVPYRLISAGTACVSFLDGNHSVIAAIKKPLVSFLDHFIDVKRNGGVSQKRPPPDRHDCVLTLLPVQEISGLGADAPKPMRIRIGLMISADGAPKEQTPSNKPEPPRVQSRPGSPCESVRMPPSRSH
jgi:hypothetical protein